MDALGLFGTRDPEAPAILEGKLSDAHGFRRTAAPRGTLVSYTDAPPTSVQGCETKQLAPSLRIVADAVRSSLWVKYRAASEVILVDCVPSSMRSSKQAFLPSA